MGPWRHLRERRLHPQETDAPGGPAGGHDPRRSPLWLGRGPGPAQLVRGDGGTRVPAAPGQSLHPHVWARLLVVSPGGWQRLPALWVGPGPCCAHGAQARQVVGVCSRPPSQEPLAWPGDGLHPHHLEKRVAPGCACEGPLAAPFWRDPPLNRVAGRYVCHQGDAGGRCSEPREVPELGPPRPAAGQVPLPRRAPGGRGC